MQVLCDIETINLEIEEDIRTDAPLGGSTEEEDIALGGGSDQVERWTRCEGKPTSSSDDEEEG